MSIGRHSRRLNGGAAGLRSAPPRLVITAIAIALAVVSLAAIAGAQDLQSQLDSKRSQLEQEQGKKQVLSTDLQRYGEQIDDLAGQVAVLRNREALVVAELRRVQAHLRNAKDRLEVLHRRLHRSLGALRNRLVDIYRSNEPDMLTVILQSDGFDDLLSRYEYLRRVEAQDADVVGRVRGLRNQTRETVVRVEADRDRIEAKKAELVRTRSQLEARQAELDAVRDQKAAALDSVNQHIDRLEGDVSDLQDRIASQIQASTSTAAPLPVGPIQGGESSAGMIWPVNGPITSPFCEQRAWESCHPGIDIGVPAGTPIRAAKAGRVILAAPTGGYGNYTCIDHGGGLSTCYAHQSSFAVSVGDTVSQGQVIGYVGCTGLCFGDHLHFEVRVNGAVTDPLGYLP
jgi:murein DD-endopeptidase MepM/ murein hydrolase activator NlpD